MNKKIKLFIKYSKKKWVGWILLYIVNSFRILLFFKILHFLYKLFKIMKVIKVELTIKKID